MRSKNDRALGSRMVFEMEEDEDVLSDVHVYFPFQKDEFNDFAYTRFLIRCCENNHCISDDASHCNEDKGPLCNQLGDDNGSDSDDMHHDANPLYIQHNISDDDINHSTQFNDAKYSDEEGDFVIKRKKERCQFCEVITIEHQLATCLKDVGLQVWRGALLLVDFIIDNEQMFSGCYGLELGAGVGLCSIALGRVAAGVFCTDIGEDILKNCQRNVEINSHLYKNSQISGDDQTVVKVKQLDWTKDHLSEDVSCDFCWSKEDKEQLDKVSVLIAADVIYDNHLTDALFKQILYLLRKNTVLYLAIEKRINFTLEFLEVSCPAYNHFVETLQTLQSEKVLRSRTIRTSFKQYLDYERVKELELWEIKTC